MTNSHAWSWTFDEIIDEMDGLLEPEEEEDNPEYLRALCELGGRLLQRRTGCTTEEGGGIVRLLIVESVT
jgi:hypothetical protein